MTEIIVLAHARSKNGREAELEKTMRAAVKPTHAETGCLKYAFHQSTNDKQTFVMIEKWASQEALDEHLKMPHIQELFKKIPALVQKPMQIQIYKSFPDGSPEKLL